MQAQEAGQQPVTVDAGVPVKAAIEGRVQGLRPPDILRPGHHVIELVGIFLVHMPQGDPGKLCGKFSREDGRRRHTSGPC